MGLRGLGFRSFGGLGTQLGISLKLQNWDYSRLGGFKLAAFAGAPKSPKGPCTQTVYTLAPKYLNRDYFKAKVYTISLHGTLGKGLGRGSALLG